MQPDNQPFDYGVAGFDGFLQRSIGGTGGMFLTESRTQGGGSRVMNFEQMQISGALGNKLSIGSITLDGTTGTITVGDGENIRVLIGRDTDGF